MGIGPAPFSANLFLNFFESNESKNIIKQLILLGSKAYKYQGVSIH